MGNIGRWSPNRVRLKVLAGTWPVSFLRFIAKTQPAVSATRIDAYSLGLSPVDQSIIQSHRIDGTYYLYVSKRDRNGSLLWSKTFPGPSVTTPYPNPAIDSNNNVYIAAGATSTQSPTLFSISENGDLNWVKRLGSANGLGYGSGVDSNDNAYLAGGISTGTYTQGIVAKYNSAGSLQWQRAIQPSPSTSGTAYCGNVEDDSALSQLYVVGYGPWESTGTSTFLFCINSSGTVQWSKCLKNPDTSSSLVSRHVKKLTYSSGSPTNRVVTAGILYNSNSSGLQGLGLNCLSASDGSLLWSRGIYNSASNIFLCGLDVDSDGNSYCTLRETNKLYVVKYAGDGTIQWQRVIDATNFVPEVQPNIKVSGDQILISVHQNSGNNRRPYLFALNKDGSDTGAYTIDSVVFTISASSLTSFSPAVTASALTNTVWATPSLSDDDLTSSYSSSDFSVSNIYLPIGF